MWYVWLPWSTMWVQCHKQSLLVLILCYEPRWWGSARQKPEHGVTALQSTKQRTEYNENWRRVFSSDVQRGAHTLWSSYSIKQVQLCNSTISAADHFSSFLDTGTLCGCIVFNTKVAHQVPLLETKVKLHIMFALSFSFQHHVGLRLFEIRIKGELRYF